MVDGIPHSESDKTDRYISNVMCVTFDNLQSGYLAGYIAVKNGNTKLGYFGQYNSDDSANYGAGFAQGAAAAANELGVRLLLIGLITIHRFLTITTALHLPLAIRKQVKLKIKKFSPLRLKTVSEAVHIKKALT